MSDLTQILRAVQNGEPRAAVRLLPRVYAELRKLSINHALPRGGACATKPT